MSETKNLKLFKHNEPLETNENQFNIDLALNQNWDKLDNFAEKVNDKVIEIEDKHKQYDTDISNIKQEQQDQNSKIENNTVENKDNTELLNQIIGILPSAKGEGEHVTLDNTAEARFKKFGVQGNSKQENREGYNLLNIEKEFTLTGSKLLELILEAGTYTIQFDGVNTNNNNITSYVFAFYTGDTAISYQHITKEAKKKTFTLNSNVNKIRIWSADNDSEAKDVTTTYKNLMIYAGNEEKKYEQYGVTPSPEYPSRIRNVGDNINLFNKDGNVIHSYDSKLEPIETGVKVTLKIVGTSRYCVMKLGGSELLGKKLVAHGNVVISGQNDGIIGIYFGADNNFTINWIADTGILGKNIKDFNRVLTIPDTFPEGCNSIYIIFYANGISAEAKVGDYVEYRNLKIEEGTQATAYSPYNCGNAEITVGNKNLANTKIIKNTNIITVNEDGSITLANNSNTAGYASTGKKLNELCKGLKVGDTAYLKLITTSTNNIYLQGKANQYWLGNNSNKITKDMLEDTVIVYGGYNKTDKLQIQITKNTIGDYAQNKQQTIVFPFTEGQRLYKGDYLAEDGIHHVRNQIVLDGTEGWQLGGSGNNLINQRFYLANNDIKPNGAILCNYFKEMYRGNIQITVEDIEACNISNGRYIQIKINKKIASTVDEFKNWIKQKKNEGNPITLECEVESEIIEPYTQEQQEAYNKLKKLYSYNEQTNIFSKDEISPVFNVEAIKNLNATFAQLSATMLERS